MNNPQNIGSTIDSTWYLYLIQCGDGSIYTGITTDVERRFEEHRSGGKKAARYLRGRGPLKLVFKALIGDKGMALKMEYRVKQLSKLKKQALIQGNMDLNLLRDWDIE
ncbi:MAG: GIY-YIG nuclease family protein [Calditrichota bacterium]